MKEWNPVDSIRDDLIEMIFCVKSHHQSITRRKVASICDDAAKIMSLIESYKGKKLLPKAYASK